VNTGRVPALAPPARWRNWPWRPLGLAEGLPALLVLGLLVRVLAFPGALRAQEAVQWHGYAQIRYGRDDPADGFSLRRGKLWLGGSVPGMVGLSFKVQGVFRNSSQGAFILQDIFAEYRRDWGKVVVGQLIPDFSLQRSQPDFLVPLVERARVIDLLIPGARTLARDMGIQAVMVPPGSGLHLGLGLFNGSGANRLVASEGDVLTTGRLTLSRDLRPDVRVTLGGSVAWRKANGIDVGALSTTGTDFTGEDFRWGAETRLVAGRWQLQGEYLRAHLEKEESQGFYLLGTLALDALNQASISIEDLDTPRDGPAHGPWIILGGAHVFSEAPSTSSEAMPPGPVWKGPFPTQLMGDLRVRRVEGELRWGGALQLQVFFH